MASNEERPPSKKPRLTEYDRLKLEALRFCSESVELKPRERRAPEPRWPPHIQAIAEKLRERSSTSAALDYYEVATIEAERTIFGRKEFFVRYKGYDRQHNEWVPASEVKARQLIKEFKNPPPVPAQPEAGDLPPPQAPGPSAGRLRDAIERATGMPCEDFEFRVLEPPMPSSSPSSSTPAGDRPPSPHVEQFSSTWTSVGERLRQFKEVVEQWSCKSYEDYERWADLPSDQRVTASLRPGTVASEADNAATTDYAAPDYTATDYANSGA
ncbi:hypothetical protein AAVH_32360 [Aphelenchoides avenae]|nr:hypothetical protein AAVH_32360 [Aphelenchus avenae]